MTIEKNIRDARGLC